MTLDNSEITARLYDTIMKNPQWPHIFVDDIEDQFVDSRKGYIEMNYGNKIVEIRVMSREIV
jgi:hypothetical protein